MAAAAAGIDLCKQPAGAKAGERFCLAPPGSPPRPLTQKLHLNSSPGERPAVWKGPCEEIYRRVDAPRAEACRVPGGQRAEPGCRGAARQLVFYSYVQGEMPRIVSPLLSPQLGSLWQLWVGKRVPAGEGCGGGFAPAGRQRGWRLLWCELSRWQIRSLPGWGKQPCHHVCP